MATKLIYAKDINFKQYLHRTTSTGHPQRAHHSHKNVGQISCVILKNLFNFGNISVFTALINAVLRCYCTTKIQISKPGTGNMSRANKNLPKMEKYAWSTNKNDITLQQTHIFNGVVVFERRWIDSRLRWVSDISELHARIPPRQLQLIKISRISR